MTEYIEEVQVSSDGGIVKKIITAGESGDIPTKGQEVTVEYEGRLENGTVFDNSKDHGEPLKIRIGEGQVIEGWDQGIMSMRLGEKADLFIKSKYGYGDMGSPPKIPGGATLIFTVELLQIADRRPTRWQMSDQELIQVALRQKEDGNAKAGAKKFKQAEGHYKDAMSHLNACKINNEEINKLKVVCLQNMSICLNSTGDFRDAINQCTVALGIDDKAFKARYLRGQAKLGTKEFDGALEDVKAAIILNPKDKNLRLFFDKIKAEKKKHLQSQQATMQKFFAQGVYNEKDGAKDIKVFDKLPDYYQENAQVFFEIAIGDEGDAEEDLKGGKIIFELFSKKVPKTAENFRQMCTGEKGEGYHYMGNIFHRIIKGFMAQGGDITAQNGTGGMSIYGHKFDDEGIWYPHSHKGVLSMANAGPNTNGSQFFILFGPTPHLNEKHTVFGRVISGYDVVTMMEENPTAPGDKPIKTIRIVDCGELDPNQKLNHTNADFMPNYIDVPMNLTDMHIKKEHEDDTGSDRESDEEEQKVPFGQTQPPK